MAVSAPRPHPLLAAHAGAIPRAGAVLDLHARAGDDALYLAQRGFAVEAVAAEGDALLARAGDLDLRVDLIGADPRTAAPIRGRFAAVLALDLLPTLAEDDAEALLGRIPAWIAPGGLVLLSGVRDGAVHSSWQPEQLEALFWGFAARREEGALVLRREG